jgi:hypothetical protein
MSVKTFDDARSILLLGETGRDELTRKLQTLVSTWAAKWSAHRFDVTLEQTQDGLRRRCAAWIGEVQGRVLLQVQTPAELVPALMGKHAATSAGTLAQAVTEELDAKIVQSLCEYVTRAAGVDRVDARRVESTPPEERHAHVARITVRDTRTNLWIVLSSCLVERLIKRPSVDPSMDPLVLRRGALAEATLGLQAVLGTAEVSLMELTQLSEGDVIVLSSKLVDPLSLTNESGQLVARAKLGSAGTDRAVSIVTIHDRR